MFSHDHQLAARAASAHRTIVGELRDVAAQGATLTADQADELRSLLDAVSPTKTTRKTK